MDVYNQFANFYSVIFLLSDPSVFVPQIYRTLQLRYHHFKKNQVLFRFLVKMSAVQLFSGADFYSIGIYRHFVWGESRSLFWLLCFRKRFPEKCNGSTRLHCQQPFWARENYSEELKHPPRICFLVFYRNLLIQQVFPVFFLLSGLHFGGNRVN